MKRVAIYCRVSSSHQTTENQILELRSISNRLGYIITEEYVDNAISGTKSRADRPALDKLLNDGHKNRFDMVLCYSICRMGRNVSNLVEILSTLQSLNIDMYFVQQGINTENSAGRMMFSIFGALAEYERELLKDRIAISKHVAKLNGKKLGRPSSVSGNEGMISAVKLLRNQGLGIKTIAKNLQIGVGTTMSILKNAA
jgi:DNA invertase Pin-like site-specific DNA recombinase